MPVRAFAVPPPTGFKEAVVAELEQGVQVLGTFESDITAPAAVTAARSAAGNKLLPTESHATVSTTAAGDMYLRFVY